MSVYNSPKRVIVITKKKPSQVVNSGEIGLTVKGCTINYKGIWNG